MSFDKTFDLTAGVYFFFVVRAELGMYPLTWHNRKTTRESENSKSLDYTVRNMPENRSAAIIAVQHGEGIFPLIIRENC